jgi:hypothetical protein
MRALFSSTLTLHFLRVRHKYKFCPFESNGCKCIVANPKILRGAAVKNFRQSVSCHDMFSMWRCPVWAEYLVRQAGPITHIPTYTVEPVCCMTNVGRKSMSRTRARLSFHAMFLCNSGNALFIYWYIVVGMYWNIVGKSLKPPGFNQFR